MTKIAEFPSFTPEQLSDMRDIFSRFEHILDIFSDFQKSFDGLDCEFGCPVVSVLELFADSWYQNCLLFNRFLPSSDFHFEEIACQIRSSLDIFTASEKAVSSGLLSFAPGSSEYSFLLECVFLRCRTLLISSRNKLKKRGIPLEEKKKR